jgi:hypothetical protein
MTYVICMTVETGPFCNVFANFKVITFFRVPSFPGCCLTAAVFG